MIVSRHMTFHILTIFPELFAPYLHESVIGKGIARGKIRVKVYNLRNYTTDKHGKVDDKPYGGGPGMVIRIEPLVVALRDILKGKTKGSVGVAVMTPGGTQFNNKVAGQLAKRGKHLVIIAGRYEGIDARLAGVVYGSFGIRVKHISVGPYVLTGGELPALVVVDAVARQIEGVLGKSESLEERRYGVGVPVYSRPEVFEYGGRQYRVPRVLTSGDHGQIDKWRKGKSKSKSA